MKFVIFQLNQKQGLKLMSEQNTQNLLRLKVTTWENPSPVVIVNSISAVMKVVNCLTTVEKSMAGFSVETGLGVMDVNTKKKMKKI